MGAPMAPMHGGSLPQDMMPMGGPMGGPMGQPMGGPMGQPMGQMMMMPMGMMRMYVGTGYAIVQHMPQMRMHQMPMPQMMCSPEHVQNFQFPKEQWSQPEPEEIPMLAPAAALGDPPPPATEGQADMPVRIFDAPPPGGLLRERSEKKPGREYAVERVHWPVEKRCLNSGLMVKVSPAVSIYGHKFTLMLKPALDTSSTSTAPRNKKGQGSFKATEGRTRIHVKHEGPMDGPDQTAPILRFRIYAGNTSLPEDAPRGPMQNDFAKTPTAQLPAPHDVFQLQDAQRRQEQSLGVQHLTVGLECQLIPRDGNS